MIIITINDISARAACLLIPVELFNSETIPSYKNMNIGFKIAQKSLNISATKRIIKNTTHIFFLLLFFIYVYCYLFIIPLFFRLFNVMYTFCVFLFYIFNFILLIFIFCLILLFLFMTYPL